ncbi:nucleotidyltransferase family protein [Fredinandcohnia sp. 179-A 10B2 NHS]|uniref:nucleotidyltransferase domain-containing protein n=1 Tax=Fredinandcohnia sp. 179-A 10B2 NHS TaxID=3235176 RepID=UPI0039A2740A
MNIKNQLDLTNIPRETLLLLEICKWEDVVTLPPNQRALFDNIDWELLMELALHHRVYPFIFPKLKSLEEKLVPDNIMQQLSHYYRNNTFKMLQLCGEMEQVSQLFLKNEIHPLFLKGPVLATDLYGDLSLRTSGDLDVLIPIEDLQKAEELILRAGYEKDEYIQSVLNDWKWRHHHFTYFHPSKGIKLEIHWRLNPAPSMEPSFSDLWKRKRIYSTTSFPVYILGIEDLFLFLVTHGARHGWSRLRWLTDIQQIVKKDIDWVSLTRHVRKYKCNHIAGQALVLSAQLLGSKGLSHQLEPLTTGKRPFTLAQQAIFYIEKMVNLHSEPLPQEISDYHKKHLLSLMTLRQKVIHTLSTFYPYYTDVETLPLPNRLHFLYFVLRPFLLLWRRTKKYSLN